MLKKNREKILPRAGFRKEKKKICCEIGKSCETGDCILGEMKLLRLFYCCRCRKDLSNKI